MSMKELKEALEDKNLTIGTETTLKKLRNGELKTIFLAKNCPSKVRDTIKHYAKISKVNVLELDIKNEELGIICKKLFSISVLSC